MPKWLFRSSTSFVQHLSEEMASRAYIVVYFCTLYLLTYLVGGFNPSEKYESKWESSPTRGENKKYLKPAPSYLLVSVPVIDDLTQKRIIDVRKPRPSTGFGIETGMGSAPSLVPLPTSTRWSPKTSGELYRSLISRIISPQVKPI